MANSKPIYISLSPQEKKFCDFVLAGKGQAASYRLAFKDEIEKFDSKTGAVAKDPDGAIRQAAKRLADRADIQEAIRWLEETPEQQQIIDVMRHNLMFGDKNDQTKAAEFLFEAKFATRDAVALWLDTLIEIGADVITECNGEMHLHKLKKA